ncbi:MAG: DNA repair protein RecN, partial [Desulfovibrionaceae bacterium]|nr:DNA repair protein RecN [Desulfovibrionaceae bacterium]
YTSQHGQQKLLQPAFQEALMEQALDRPDLLAERAAILADLEKIRGKIRDLEARRDRLLEVRDLLEMQQAEIDKVNPQPDEDDELEELRLKVRRQEEAARDYDEALGMLYGNGEGGLLDGLAEFGRLLERLAETDERLASSCESVTALTDDLRRLGGDLRRPPVPDDLPDDIESVEARLYELSALKRKLRRDLPSILNLKKEIEEKIDFLDVCALDIKELRRREAARAQDLARLVETLIPLRRTACQAFAARLESELRGLGFSDQARVLPDFKPRKLWDNVTDEAVRILWAPNPGQPAQPLDLIASGGELSRFLLALAGVAPAEHRPTFIFDEVDSGVGGVTLNHLAERLERLAGRQQMLLVTHWPQIAARAKKHFQISKVVRDGRTYTTCLPLKGRDLHDELVRMGGGGAQGEALASALEHRKELPRSA